MARATDLHDWDLSRHEAVELQKELRSRVCIEPLVGEVRTVAGCDISFNRYEEIVYAGVVVLRLPDLAVIERQGVRTVARFPYVPGLLSFREIPALIEAWRKLDTEPDLVMMDGQGIAHPRRMGIAAHFGLVVDRPTIGVAKSILVGDYEDPGESPGSFSPLVHRGETVGAAVRTKRRAGPVFVSPGHLVAIPDSIRLVLECDGGYRIPEPTRQAHLFVNELRREAGVAE